MSVRKSASRSAVRELSGSAHGLKSFGVWALAAAASFVVGLFILSPLINVAAGSRSAAPDTSMQSAPAPLPTPAPRSAAPTLAVAPHMDRPVDSDVGISVEKPRQAENPEVQTPQGVDQTATGRTDEPRDTISTSTREDRSPRLRRTTDGANAQTDRTADGGTAATDRTRDDNTSRTSRKGAGDRSEDPQQTDSIDRSGRSDHATRNRSTDSTSEPKPRRSRRTKKSSTQEADSPSRNPGTSPGSPGDVQKGDNIDR